MTQALFPDSPDLSSPNAEEMDPSAEGAVDSSFGDILSQFEHDHKSRGETVEGTVVSVTPDGVFVDIGRKNDGVLPVDPNVAMNPGIKVIVSILGRDEEGNYRLSTIKV